MKTKITLLTATFLATMIAFLLCLHGPSLGFLPRECHKCHLPTVIGDGVVQGPVAGDGRLLKFRCLRCGERWRETEGRPLELETPITPWTALVYELTGFTDSGPLDADGKLPSIAETAGPAWLPEQVDALRSAISEGLPQ